MLEVGRTVRTHYAPCAIRPTLLLTISIIDHGSCRIHVGRVHLRAFVSVPISVATGQTKAHCAIMIMTIASNTIDLLGEAAELLNSGVCHHKGKQQFVIVRVNRYCVSLCDSFTVTIERAEHGVVSFKDLSTSRKVFLSVYSDNYRTAI